MNEFSFDQFKEMSPQELKATVSKHPEVINQVAREILYKKNLRHLPFYAHKLIECITDEKTMQSEAVQELFSVLQLNHFLGLSKNELLREAFKEDNYILAGELLSRGAKLEESFSPKEMIDSMKELLVTGPYQVFNACIDYLLEYFMEEFTSHNSDLQSVLEMAFNNPKLSDCKIIIKNPNNEERDVYINQKILSLPKNTMVMPQFIGNTFEMNVEDPQTLIDLIRFCYGEEIDVNDSNVHPLLEAAKKYNSPELEALCEHYIKTHPSENQE